MGCFQGLMKFSLTAVNILVILIGLLFIGFASTMLTTAPASILYYMYISGGIFFVVALIGCCGIVKENVCMTTTYAMLILVLIVVQILGNVFVMDSTKVQDLAEKEVQKKWLKEQIKEGAMDKIQRSYLCCGLNSPEDYIKIGRLFYPKSCYVGDNINDPTGLYRTGCITAERDFFLRVFNRTRKSNWASLGITVAVFAASIYLVFRFKSSNSSYSY